MRPSKAVAHDIGFDWPRIIAEVITVARVLTPGAESDLAAVAGLVNDRDPVAPIPHPRNLNHAELQTVLSPWQACGAAMASRLANREIISS